MGPELRASQRRWLSTGSPADEEGLTLAMLRAGAHGELSLHLEQVLTGQRSAGAVRFRLEPRAAREPEHAFEALARQLSDRAGPILADAAVLQGDTAREPLARLLGVSAAYGDERTSPADADRYAQRLLHWFGPTAHAFFLREPRFERVGQFNVRLRDDRALFGHGFEAGALLVSERLVGLLWVTDGEALCSADGRSCELRHLGVRSMNFGQHWRTPGITDVQYETSVPLHLVEQFLGMNLPEYIDDARGDPEPTPLDLALREAGWPDARGVLRRSDLSAMALEFFGHDLLVAWCGWSETPEYVANTIDAIEVMHDRVVLRGMARRASPAGTTVAYQDV